MSKLTKQGLRGSLETAVEFGFRSHEKCEERMLSKVKKKLTITEQYAALEKRVKLIEDETGPEAPTFADLWSRASETDHQAMKRAVELYIPEPESPARWPRWATVIALAAFTLLLAWKLGPIARSWMFVGHEAVGDNDMPVSKGSCPDGQEKQWRGDGWGCVVPLQQDSSGDTSPTNSQIAKFVSKDSIQPVPQPTTNIVIRPQVKCWLSISDQQGHVFREGTFPPDYELSGNMPILVRAGCPGGVRYWVNGDEIQPKESEQPHDRNKVELVELPQ